MDKANGLTRITRYVTFVGRVRMTDHLTKEMRYKPLLLDVMFRRMMEGGRFLEASPDARQEGARSNDQDYRRMWRTALFAVVKAITL